MRIQLCGILLLALAGKASDALATPPILVEQDRGVFTRATSIQPPLSAEMVDPREAVDFTPFDESVASSANTPDGIATASAGIVSIFGGSEITTGGTASAFSSSGSSEARSEAPADSLFDVVFEASAGEPFLLAGSVQASATSGDSYASVVLKDLDSDLVLIAHHAGPGQGIGFRDPGTFQAGTRYRLTAFGLAYALSEAGAGPTSSDANYSATLYLPEPSRSLSLAPGLITLSLIAWQRARRRPR